MTVIGVSTRRSVARTPGIHWGGGRDDGSKTGGRSSLKGQIVVKRVVKACRKEKST
jgi:hypothetical protein